MADTQKSKEVLQAGQQTLKTEGDINGQLKEQIKTLDQVVKAYEKINAKVKVSQELGRDVKDLEVDIFKNLIEQTKLQDKLNELKQTNSNIVEDAKKKGKEIEELLKKEKESQDKLNQLKLDSNILTEKQKKDQQGKIQAEEDILNKISAQLASKKESLSFAEAEALVANEALELNLKTLETLQKRAAEEELITNRLGITGNLLKGTYGLINKLGLGAFMNLSAITQRMQIEAQNGVSRSKIMMTALKESLASIGQALTDPLTIVTGIVSAFKYIIKAAIDFQSKTFEIAKNLGMGVTESEHLFKNFQNIAWQNGELAMTAKQLAETYGQINDALGVIGPQNAEFLTTTTGIQRRLGVSADEMQDIQLYSLQTGKSLKDGFSSIIGSAKAQGARLKVAMTEKQIMEGISKVSATVFNNFKGNVKQIGEAVVKAAKLGITLDEIQNASYQFLDFESSISKEFEAQLLTGRDIDLSRARQLALTGSTEELMGEITKQLGSQAQWNNMNVLQQQSLAEAMGLSKEAVDEMFKKQQLIAVLGEQAGASSQTQYNLLLAQGKTHDEIARLIGDQAAGDALRASVQDKMAATMERINDSIGRMSQAFMPLIEGFANVLSNATALKVLLASAGTIAGVIAFMSIQAANAKKKEALAQLEVNLLQKEHLAAQLTEAARERVTATMKAAGAASGVTGGSAYLGPGALAVGLAVFAGLMGLMASVGGGGGGAATPSMSMPSMPSIEPVNKEAKAAESTQAKNFSQPTQVNKYYAIQVDAINGTSLEKQVSKDYYNEKSGGQFRKQSE